MSILYQFHHKLHFFTIWSVGDVRVKNSDVEETKPERLARQELSAKVGTDGGLFSF
ncbi:MAG: hypothetical protein M3512_01465 [Bacteroidota bacterium]|nr:hypothetical protein [Bacteroidota bacterium]